MFAQFTRNYTVPRIIIGFVSQHFPLTFLLLPCDLGFFVDSHNFRCCLLLRLSTFVDAELLFPLLLFDGEVRPFEIITKGVVNTWLRSTDL